MKIQIGSLALIESGITLPRNENKVITNYDRDWFIPESVVIPQNKPSVFKDEYYVIPDGIFETLKKYTKVVESGTGETFFIASPELLLTIKMSHMSWDIHWEKTFHDVVYLKCSENIEPIREVYDLLKKFWETEHGNKDFLSLNKTKDEFFDDFVEYDYDHDYLHEVVASFNEDGSPMYTKCLADGESVLIDKNKFFAMEIYEQQFMFREEIAVIASERWILKHGTSWVKAYYYALKKTIISLTKNWATDFIIWNIDYYSKLYYDEFLRIYTTFDKPEMLDIGRLEELLLGVNDNPLYEPRFSNTTLVYAFLSKDYEEYDIVYGNLSRTTYFDLKSYLNTMIKVLDVKKGCIGCLDYRRVVIEVKGELFAIEYIDNSMYNTSCLRYSIKRVEQKVKMVTEYKEVL